MVKPYKLKDEIKQFIVEKKKIDTKLSCRKLVSLIKEQFNINLSKSTINAIIKENSLSGKVGRPRIRLITASPKIEPIFEAVNFVSPVLEPVHTKEDTLPVSPPKPQPIAIETVEEESADIANGGAIFLLMVDYKSGLTNFLAQKILAYMPDLSQDIIRLLLQLRVYGQIIKEEQCLVRLLGKQLTGEYLAFYYEQIAKIPLNQLNPDFTGLGLERNINEINMLYKECLLCLNRQAQKLFLPSVYQFLDFSAMCERFYSLIARVTRKDTVITVQFLYPANFKAVHDIVWQEDFKFAVSALNKERLFTPEGKLFRFEEMLAAY